MTEENAQDATAEHELTGPAKDFEAFTELEFERRRNSDQDFDADLFREAVALVLRKLQV